MVSFTLNNRQVSLDADPSTPLLWAIRDHVGLTGTKYGCGAGLCGACTIHVDGIAQRSCQVDVGSVAGKTVVTGYPVRRQFVEATRAGGIERFALDVKRQVSPRGPMGVGLWLSAAAAKALRAEGNTRAFGDWLRGVGLVPAFARRSAARTPGAWIAVDSPDCRRTVTLYWGADSHLSAAARLMRTTITSWDWITGEPQEKR